MPSDRISQGLESLATLAHATARRSAELVPIVAAMRACLEGGGTLYFAGNGGSAADAQHLATEYVVRFHAGQRGGFRALALTTDSSVLTAGGNDLGFAEIFARQLEVLARPGDLLVVHSTSGNSPNIVRAVEAARELGIPSVALLGGDGGRVLALADHAFVVDSTRVSLIQEMHLAIQHQIAAVLTGDASS